MLIFGLFASFTGDVASDKPTVLWSLYFNQAISDSSCVADLPSNMHVLDMPGVTIGFGEALQQVCVLYTLLLNIFEVGHSFSLCLPSVLY